MHKAHCVRVHKNNTGKLCTETKLRISSLRQGISAIRNLQHSVSVLDIVSAHSDKALSLSLSLSLSLCVYVLVMCVHTVVNIHMHYVLEASPEVTKIKGLLVSLGVSLLK